MTHLFVKSLPQYIQMVFAEMVIGDGLIEKQGSSESHGTISPMGLTVSMLVFTPLQVKAKLQAFYCPVLQSNV